MQVRLYIMANMQEALGAPEMVDIRCQGRFHPIILCR